MSAQNDEGARPGATRQSENPFGNPSQSKLAPQRHERNGWQGPPLVAMRVRAAWWVGLGALERLALAHLHDMQNPGAGGSYASQSTLAAWCGVTRRGMQKALARLVAAGLVVATGQLAHDHPLVVAGRATPGVVVYRVQTATQATPPLRTQFAPPLRTQFAQGLSVQERSEPRERPTAPLGEASPPREPPRAPPPTPEPPRAPSPELAKAKPLTPLTTVAAARARAAELAAELGLQVDAAALARLGGALMAQAATERTAKGVPAYKAPAWVRATRMTREQAQHALRHGPLGWRDAEVEAAESAAEARKAAEAQRKAAEAAEAAEAQRKDREQLAAKHAELARALAARDFAAWVELAMQPGVGGGLWLAVARLTGDERDRALRSAFSKAIEAAKPKPPAPTAAPTADSMAALVAAQRAGLARRRAEVAA